MPTCSPRARTTCATISRRRDTSTSKCSVRQQQVADGKTEIDYVVDPGIRHRFVYLAIDGNKYFDTKTIRERMFLTPEIVRVPQRPLQRSAAQAR